jgi:glycosyltransferase involved in cell wall biosynthesis
MARIYLDATPLLHGVRALRRNTTNLYRHVLRAGDGREYVFPYFRGSRNATLELEGARETIPISWPWRLLEPCFLHLGWPCIEDLAGPCDVYYAPEMIFPPARRARVLSTIRGVLYYEVPSLCPDAALRWMLTMHNYALRHSTHWLAVSECTRARMLERDKLDPARVFVVSHGVDPMFTPMPRAAAQAVVKARFGLERPYLLYVGILDRNKNITGLLKMFSRLQALRREVDLVLVGPPGTATDEVQAAMHHPEPGTSVRWLGPVETDDSALVSLYNAAELLVHLSHYEGWCAPPLEAMACGIPVVLGDVPSLREVGAEAAVYAPVGDAEAAAAAVTRLLESSHEREARRVAGQAVAARHSWPRAAQIFVGVLRRIAEEA